jgi:hypothetical protein
MFPIHGRSKTSVPNMGGLHLMRPVMDKVSLERERTEVPRRKESGNEQKTPARRIQNRVARR